MFPLSPARRLAAPATAVCLALAAVAPAPAFAHGYKIGAIEIGHPWSRAMPPGARTGAGYLTLANHGTEPDRLVSITSPAATEVQVHDMSVKDGVMTMRQVEGGLAVPAGGEARLAPGGLHLMLLGVKEPFREGQMVPLHLTFERAGAVDVELKVDAMGAPGAHAAHTP
ncbi:copper chaperone PCu(A)C [Aureimonas flava]|uniref:Copper chaperone PCu(A)C n=1 Tax=Aureimonas flava TaxID=2320271 RepID=A0A3A1WQX3_9HYPH|nr:copper chaperone PCu(A)C [Aureimonas flava]RIY03454.1 copper chaperone PCu(A)C [Aureimonas flava]